MCSNRWVGLKLGAKPSRQYKLYNGGKLSSNMDRDRLDLRKSVPECERFIKDCYRKINSHTQEIADCNQKIDELPKRINRMMDFGKESRIERKKMEQEAECLRSKADSFCLRGMLGREVYGSKSQKHNELLNKAENSARKKIRRENDAKAYEKSAIGYETNAKELEKIINEFRGIKGELQSEKERLEKSLPKM